MSNFTVMGQLRTFLETYHLSSMHKTTKSKACIHITPSKHFTAIFSICTYVMITNTQISLYQLNNLWLYFCLIWIIHLVKEAKILYAPWFYTLLPFATYWEHHQYLFSDLCHIVSESFCVYTFTSHIAKLIWVKYILHACLSKCTC